MVEMYSGNMINYILCFVNYLYIFQAFFALLYILVEVFVPVKLLYQIALVMFFMHSLMQRV